jgi:hypothetical protein
MYKDKRGNPSTVVTFTISDIIEVLYTCLWPTNGLISIITACPIILFAFSCQCNVCAIFTELPDTIIQNNTRTTIGQRNHTINTNSNNSNNPPSTTTTTTTTCQQQLLQQEQLDEEEDDIIHETTTTTSYTPQSQHSSTTTTCDSILVVPDSFDTVPTSNITASVSQVTLRTIPSSTIMSVQRINKL